MGWTFYNSNGEQMIEDGGMTIANNANNRVVTATGADPASLNGEANLTFDGEHLTVGDGNLVIGTAGHGIDFSNQASPASGMASELLDRYEEGTFTPTVFDDNTEVDAYTRQIGTYTRIGNKVFCSIWVIVNGITGVTGSEGANIRGLPFTSVATTNHHQGFSVGYASGLAITASCNVGGYINENTTYARLELWDATGGTTILTMTELGSGGSLKLSFTYEVAT